MARLGNHHLRNHRCYRGGRNLLSLEMTVAIKLYHYPAIGSIAAKQGVEHDVWAVSFGQARQGSKRPRA
jgi:hypothetical protein